jgi:hypothetical protein
MFTQEDIIYTYTRKQAIEDGMQLLADQQLSKEAGIKYPVYLTSGLVALLKKGDFIGRLWDVYMLFRYYAKHADSNVVIFTVKIGRKNVRLIAEIGATDFDNPSPAITIMLPEER